MDGNRRTVVSRRDDQRRGACACACPRAPTPDFWQGQLARAAFLALIHTLLARIQVELSHVILDRFLYSVAGLFVVAFFVLTTSHAALRGVAGQKPPRVTCFRWGQFSFCFSCIIAINMYFCLMIRPGFGSNRLENLRFAVMQLAVSKVLIWALRLMALTHLDLVDTAMLQTINIVSFVVTVANSLQIRARWGVLGEVSSVEGSATSVLWSTCGTSILIWLVEACTCILSCSINVWVSSSKFTRIHVQTLGNTLSHGGTWNVSRCSPRQ